MSTAAIIFVVSFALFVGQVFWALASRPDDQEVHFRQIAQGWIEQAERAEHARSEQDQASPKQHTDDDKP